MKAHCIELLEARIAPATLVGLDNNNHLLSFDSASPGTMLSSKTVTGLPAGENLIGIDFRPATGGLYGVTMDGMGTGRIYLLNPSTGAAVFSAVMLPDPTDSTAPYSTLAGTNFGTDFNPVVDRLRLVSDTGANLRINVDTGVTTTDGGLNPTGFNLAGAAYSNAFPGATGTTLYGLDIVGDGLVVVNPPNNGTLNSVGALGVAVDGLGGFDIFSTRTAGGAVTNVGYAALTVGGVTGLYTIDLASGAATAVGSIFNGSVELRGLTAQTDPPPTTAFTIDENNRLWSFNTATPNGATDRGILTGLGAGEAVIGFDYRPANGTLYAVTKTATGEGRLYSINPGLSSATLVTTLVSSATGTPFTGLAGTSFGVDFNPVVDRLRIVSDSGQNLRVSVETGVVIVDTPLNGAATGGTQAAYTNSFAGAAATTLYGIDSATDQLFIQNPPNNGTLTLVGSLGVDATAVGGFDIRSNGEAYATLVVGGTTGLYRVNLQSGAATLVGQVGALASSLGFALVPTGTLQLSTTTLDVAEGAGTLQFTIDRVGGTEGTISVVVSTGGGTAVAGTDYTGFSRVLTFGPGVTSQTFTVTLLDDAVNEANHSFQVTLSDAVGGAALNARNTATVNILNDDPLSVTARAVTYTDGDGDLVTLKINKGTLTPGLLKFAPSGLAGGVQLQAIDLTGASFDKANLTVTAKRVAGKGDSFANVGHINATGNILGTVTIDGDLGQIDAASVKALTVQSMGQLGLTTQGAGGSLESNFTGNLSKLTVKSDLRDVHLVALLNIGAVSIGGNLTGGAAAYSGSLEAGGKIASVKILGSLQGDTGAFSGSIIAKTVGTVNIRGDMDRGSILLSGNASATTAKQALAMNTLTVGGSVENSRVLVGYDRAGVAANADVATGAIKVTGDWLASNLAVGVRAGDDGAFGTDDDRLIAPVGGVVAKIASIAVRGQILGTTGLPDDAFAFTAEEIGAFTVGKAKLAMTKAGLEDFGLGATFDVRVRETNVAG